MKKKPPANPPCQRCGADAVTPRVITLWSAPLERDVHVLRPACDHCGAIQKILPPVLT